MNTKRISQSVMLCALMALAASITPAQSPFQRCRSANPPAVNSSTPVATDNNRGAAPQGGPETAQNGGLLDILERQKKALAGSWLITLGCGCKILTSFTSDGIAISSGQGDIQPAGSPVPSSTSAYGAWRHIGGRQFAVTLVIIGYDVANGEFRGTLKVRLTLVLDETGDQLSGIDKAEIFDPDGHLVETFTTGTMQGTRIKVEPLD